MYGLYGALLRLAWAALLPYQIVIPRMTGGASPPWRERLGHAPPPAGERPGGVWMHAVSVGEVRLALSLVGRLRRTFPGRSIHLTTATATGRAVAEAAGDTRPDSISTLPIDLPRSMGRLLDRLRPALVLIMETEIWPNLLRLCGRRGIPVVIVNGRISTRAYPRYRLVRRFLRRVLSHVHLFSMQSQEDADRIVSLGAPLDRIRVTGNLKFDIAPPETDPAAIRARIGIGGDETLFLAGSTEPGEEHPVLEAFRMIRGAYPRSRLIHVPRHPEDGPAAIEVFRSAGLRVERFRDRESTGYDVLVIDVVGLLAELYAAADVIFVGGSFGRRGGQNLMEPAALGKAVLFGPNVRNFAAAARALGDAGGGYMVADGRALGARAIALLGDPPAAARAGEAARRVIEAHRGALDRTMSLLHEEIIVSPGAGTVPTTRT